jgi:acyl-coenzyme A thioesterase PaaI-like protein
LRVDEFAFDGDGITATFLARHDYQGTSRTLHGGIAATALDEILVWAGIVHEDVLLITAKLEVRYHRPVETTNGRVRIRARVDDRSGRRLKISGEIDGPDGKKSVSATGLYLVSHTIGDLIAQTSE